MTIGDYAILGGFSGVHQFCRIGAHAMIGAGAIVLQDVPPFVTAVRLPGEAARHQQRRTAAPRFLRPKTSSRSAARTRRSTATGPVARRCARGDRAEVAARSPAIRPLVDFLGVPGRGIIR